MTNSLLVKTMQRFRQTHFLPFHILFLSAVISDNGDFSVRFAVELIGLFKRLEILVNKLLRYILIDVFVAWCVADKEVIGNDHIDERRYLTDIAALDLSAVRTALFVTHIPFQAHIRVAFVHR